MYTIPAQEIKRRGIGAVDEMVRKGDVHIIRNNRPQYVVLSQELLEAQEEAYEARVLASLEGYKAGRIREGTAQELTAELGRED